MVPPLHNPIARIFVHDDVILPIDFETARSLRNAMARLKSMEVALNGKPEGRGTGGPGQLWEARPGSRQEWLRLYYTIVEDAVIVLHWGPKKKQRQDFGPARKRCAEIARLGSGFAKRCKPFA